MGDQLELRSENRFPIIETTHTMASLLEGSTLGPYLRRSIDDLYEVFSDATPSTPFVGCPHCFTPADLEYVFRTPLRSLSHGDLEEISWKLVSTLGTAADVAYFLPRLIEALAEGAPFELEVLANKIDRIPEGARTQRRVAALRKTLHFIFAASDAMESYLARDPDRDEFDELMKSVAKWSS